MGLDLLQGVLVAWVLLWGAVGVVSRFYGALLGATLAACAAAWGWYVMSEGEQIYLFGMARPLAPNAFYVLMSMMLLFNVATMLRVRRARR